ncbi:hypothetical protein ABW19_dt0203740 [Dactylella cylindrospora]|nr:hypothetical protein ABW19_dt0203740 [Dactylella cylindrospora]
MAREVASMNLPSYACSNLFSKETQEELGGGSSPISPPAVLTPTSSSMNGLTNGSSDSKFSYASAATAPLPGATRPVSIKYNSSPVLETSRTITISGSGSTVANAPRGFPHTMVASADSERANYIKSLNPRACNNFYLRGSCYNQPCPYSHKYKFTQDDIRTLKYIIERSKPCQQFKKRGYCEDEKCYYGHQCPFRTNSDLAADERCKNYNCRFCDDD